MMDAWEYGYHAWKDAWKDLTPQHSAETDISYVSGLPQGAVTAAFNARSVLVRLIFVSRDMAHVSQFILKARP